MKKLHWFFKVCLLMLFVLMIWFSLTLLSPRILPIKKASGEIRGIIFQNQLWYGNIYITGDLITLPNVQIDVKAGTKIFINKNGDKNNFDLFPWHLKNGININEKYHGILTGEPFWDEKEKIQIHFSQLNAKGTDVAPIIFTSAGENGSPYDINLINIQDGELENVEFSNYRRLEIGPEVKLIKSNFENSGDCAVCISRGSPLVLNNTFKRGRSNYIKIISSDPVIKGNRFLESEGDGILIESSVESSIRIFENIFQMPSRRAIKVESAGVRADIFENNFILGDIQLPCNNNVRLFNNLIKVNIVFVSFGGCSGEYTISSNYWEIMSSKDILNARISGESDKFKVKIPRILKTPPKGM